MSNQTKEKVEEKIRDYISKQFLVDFNDELTETTDLFKAGIIDSFGFVELVVFLEKEFKVKLNNEILVKGGLSSVSSMAAAVREKLNA